MSNNYLEIPEGRNCVVQEDCGGGIPPNKIYELFFIN